MKVVCAALCVQAVGAFIAPSTIKSGEWEELYRVELLMQKC